MDGVETRKATVGRSVGRSVANFAQFNSRPRGCESRTAPASKLTADDTRAVGPLNI
jgi:hypothetical protein